MIQECWVGKEGTQKSGTTYIAVTDRFGHVVKLITVATGAVITLAGSGSAGNVDGTGSAASLNSPHGVSYSADGTVVAVADTGNHAVRLIVVATGETSTLAGTGGRLRGRR